MNASDLAAVVADWCEAHGVGRVDLAIALLGADFSALQRTSDGTVGYIRDVVRARVIGNVIVTGKSYHEARAAALAVAGRLRYKVPA